MVTMRMRQDDCLDRQVRDLAEFSQNIRGGSRCLGCVDDDQTVIAHNHIDIRGGKAESHIDIIRQLDNFAGEIIRMRFQFRMHVNLPSAAGTVLSVAI